MASDTIQTVVYETDRYVILNAGDKSMSKVKVKKADKSIHVTLTDEGEIIIGKEKYDGKFKVFCEPVVEMTVGEQSRAFDFFLANIHKKSFSGVMGFGDVCYETTKKFLESEGVYEDD